MNRPGVISWDLLLGQSELLKNHLLMYDELWIPGLKDAYPEEKVIEEWDLDRAHLASIAYLTEQGLLKEPPVDLNAIHRDKVTTALGKMYHSALSAASKTYPTERQAALAVGAAHFNMDIALSRLVTYLLWKEKGELAYPVVFPFSEGEVMPPQLSRTHSVLSIVLKHLPSPSSEDLPLEDLVAFRRDPETQYKFAKFWHWTHNVAQGTSDQHELEEEIDWLITDYTHHLERLNKEVSNERVEVFIATPLEILEDLVKIRWSKAVHAIFGLRRKNISAASAELKLPGTELAYVNEASRLLTRRWHPSR